MKGVVFTEFLEMVEQQYSPALADDLVDSSDLPSGGAYTAVGTYAPAEMTTLVQALADRTGASVPELLEGYGQYLFGRFTVLYPAFFDGPTDALAFVATIQPVVHAEVRKLYPDAELPEFEITWLSDNELVMTYRSPRRLGDLAMGLLRGAVQHFGQPVDLVRENAGGDGATVRFTLTRQRS
jgi:hypothetical protein